MKNLVNMIPDPEIPDMQTAKRMLVESCNILLKIRNQRNECLELVEKQSLLILRQQMVIDEYRERIDFLESTQNENNPC